MKKLKYLVLALALWPVISCDKDDDKSDPAPDPATLILVKKTTNIYDNKSSTSEFTYNGKKIVSIVDSEGDQSIFTYTGDLITKIEEKNKDGVLETTTEYTYANGKLATCIVKETGEQYDEKTVYTQNTDGTISYKDFRINNATGVESDTDRSGKYTFNGGNLVKKEYSYSGTGYVSTFEYDTQKSPFKNITGFSLLLDNETIISINNMVKETQVPSSNYNETKAYIYDANGFPTEIKTFVGTTLDSTVQYIY